MSARISAAVAYLPAGSRAIALAQIRSTSSGAFGFTSWTRGYSPVASLWSTSISEALSQSLRPVTISQSTIPSTKTSARRSSGLQRACSGAM